MFRSVLLWASTNHFLASRLPQFGPVKRATKRFMPGERLEDALWAAGVLAGEGIRTTITQLGENLDSPDDADAVLEHYLKAVELIRAFELDVEISVKPTQLGLDYSFPDTLDRLGRLARAARPVPVWMDMEGSPYVDRTLDLLKAMREEDEHVGVCIQAYLRRVEDDLRSLLPLGTSLRLVKGAYLESPEVAFPDKAAVDANFLHIARLMLEAKAAGGEGRPVIATHDPRMIAGTEAAATELGLSPGDYEYAMLYGIERNEQARLAEKGHQVRVLISYGEEWFPWYMRRLAERPANLWFVLKQIAGSQRKLPAR
ncbi:MAG: proline dehydrogenase family protein [Gemmatimonadetes bacterium]|nr:proline dehydrogenase family protein [Gemmatimonadota bacterium]